MKLRSELQSVSVIIIGFILLYFMFRWEGFLWIGGLLGIPSLLSSHLRYYILEVWFKLANILGFINSRIILSIIFFLILTPIAFLSRIFSKDKMHIRKGTEKQTYFIDRNHEFTPKDFENPW